MEFNLEYPFPIFIESDSDSDSIPSLFLLQSHHMPSNHYTKSLQTNDFYFSIRRQLISLISQFSCRFNPFLSYLAINYVDRFLSSQTMPQSKPWVLKLIAISCLSLAAKMQKTEFSLSDFQGDEGIIFDTYTIQRMEFIILGALKWRMRSITPFSFIPFFIALFELKDPPLMEDLKARANEIIFKAQNDIKLLEFNPSMIAASALLSACHELFPMQFQSFRHEISTSLLVLNQENILECYNLMQEMVMDSYQSIFETVWSSDTPVNVLELHFSSSESENISRNYMNKRRKMSHYCTNQSVQISEI